MPYGLSESEMGHILRQIRMPSEQEQTISEKGGEVCVFLLGCDLDVAGILKSGSFVRQTQSEGSDLDIAYWTGSPRDQVDIKSELAELAQRRFPFADVEVGTHAVHINFPGQFPVEIDVVYVSRARVDKERRLNLAVYELDALHKRVAILACYALHAALGKRIHSYEISIAALHAVSTDLVSLVVEIVAYFSGRINAARWELNWVFAELRGGRFNSVHGIRKLSGNAAKAKREYWNNGPDLNWLNPEYDL